MEEQSAQPGTTVSTQAASTPYGDYRVRLDAYAGPLDLLLYLVKRHEIDLHDIPVAELTEQYLHHLEVIKSIDVESAGEFLVMAATLVEIKSRMIIPQSLREDGDESEDPTQDIEETADPRYELVQQLLAYKAFKDAAYALDDRAQQWEHRFPVKVKAGERIEEEKSEEVTIDLEDVNVYDLCEAFGRILETVGHIGDHAVTYDDTPISMHAEDIHDRLKSDAPTAGLTWRMAGSAAARCGSRSPLMAETVSGPIRSATMTPPSASSASTTASAPSATESLCNSAMPHRSAVVVRPGF